MATPRERKAAERERKRDGIRLATARLTEDQIDALVARDLLAAEWRENRGALEMAIALLIQQVLGD